MQSVHAHIAVAEFRKQFPAIAQALDYMRVQASRKSEGGAADPRCAGCTRIPSPRPVTRGESIDHNTQNAMDGNFSGFSVCICGNKS